MTPFEQALVDGGGSGLLTALASPYATVLMWVVPIGLEIAFVWAVFYLWRRRRGIRKDGPSLPGTPVSPVPESRKTLVVRNRH